MDIGNPERRPPDDRPTQLREEKIMEKRVAMIAIVVEDMEQAEQVNAILHTYSELIIGRMGLPCREHGVSLISIAVDGPSDEISALSGKLGNLTGVSSKAVYTKVS